MDFKLHEHTKMRDLTEVVSEKTAWVAQELASVKILPETRLKDLMHFCLALSREASYCHEDSTRYLAA
jgi:hypothetical protein